MTQEDRLEWTKNKNIHQGAKVLGRKNILRSSLINHESIGEKLECSLNSSLN